MRKTKTVHMPTTSATNVINLELASEAAAKKVSDQAIISTSEATRLDQTVQKVVKEPEAESSKQMEIFDWKKAMSDILSFDLASSPEVEVVPPTPEDDGNATDRILGELREITLANTLDKVVSDSSLSQRVKSLLLDLEVEMDISQHKGLLEFKALFEDASASKA